LNLQITNYLDDRLWVISWYISVK